MGNQFKSLSGDVQQYSARGTLEPHRSNHLNTFEEGNQRIIYDTSLSSNSPGTGGYRPQARTTAQEIEDYMRQLYRR